MKRVLVTGATGCVGRFALPKLVERGWDVWAVRSRSDAIEIPGVKWRRADLLDPADVRRIVDDSEPSHLLHLAWYIAPGKWAEAPENFSWVRASLGLLSSFKEAGGKRAVFAGSCLEYDWSYGYCSEERTPREPHTTYGACKNALQLLASAMSKSSAMTTAWGRVFFLYGPHEHPDRLVAAVTRALLAGEPARTSHGRQVRDYLYADDVAEAFVMLLESDVTGPINIGSGEAVELRAIIERIGALTGRADLLQIGAIPPAPTDKPLVVADTTRLKGTLGFEKRWDLDSGLAATIDWWRQQPRPKM